MLFEISEFARDGGLLFSVQIAEFDFQVREAVDDVQRPVVPAFEPSQVGTNPLLGFGGASSMEFGCQIPEVLLDMKQIHSLLGVFEPVFGEVPDPDRAVSDDQDCFRLEQPPLKGFGIELVLELGDPSTSGDVAAISDELIVTSDDGSYGRKALVTEPLKEFCDRDPKPSQAFVIGPTIMMKFCCDVTKQCAVPTLVSLNTIMIDGTGMCGGCRVEIDGKPKFVCVDGPEFDGHLVNFDLMMKRMNAYKKQEQSAREAYEQHRCKIGLND